MKTYNYINRVLITLLLTAYEGTWTKLSLDTLLDREFVGRHQAERVLNSEVPCVRYLDRSDREDVRLHQPR